MTTFHNSLLSSQPIISLVSDCSLADKKKSDFIGYLIPIASRTVDSTTLAEIKLIFRQTASGLKIKCPQIKICC